MYKNLRLPDLGLAGGPLDAEGLAGGPLDAEGFSGG